MVGTFRGLVVYAEETNIVSLYVPVISLDSKEEAHPCPFLALFGRRISNSPSGKILLSNLWVFFNESVKPSASFHKNLTSYGSFSINSLVIGPCVWMPPWQELRDVL
jgi:hypothetical protein